jgi:hypothetical protein
MGPKAGRAAGLIRITRPPPRGGVEEVTHSSIREGHHNLGMTQQFTAQNPANTKPILLLLAPVARLCAPPILGTKQFSIRAKVTQNRVSWPVSLGQNANARQNAIS